MYLSSSDACSHPNSSTPMPAAAIAAQNRRIARVGAHFTRGNRSIDTIMAGLTPPVASPSCGDLKTSAGIIAGSPFPNPGGGPAPTVEIMTPTQLQAWYDSWRASAVASQAAATYGAIEMPTAGGPAPGVSASGVAGLAGFSRVRVQRRRGMSGFGDVVTYTPGAQQTCVDPIVLPVETVGRNPEGAPSQIVTPTPAPGLNGWPWGLLAILAGAVVLAAATSDDDKDRRKP